VMFLFFFGDFFCFLRFHIFFCEFFAFSYIFLHVVSSSF
jgi:hypothetical protein